VCWWLSHTIPHVPFLTQHVSQSSKSHLPQPLWPPHYPLFPAVVFPITNNAPPPPKGGSPNTVTWRMLVVGQTFASPPPPFHQTHPRTFFPIHSLSQRVFPLSKLSATFSMVCESRIFPWHLVSPEVKTHCIQSSYWPLCWPPPPPFLTWASGCGLIFFPFPAGQGTWVLKLKAPFRALNGHEQQTLNRPSPKCP